MQYCSVFFLLNFLIFVCVKSDHIFFINSTQSKSLICYQCNSTNQEEVPMCQIGYFELNQSWKMLKFYFQCPKHLAEYCFLIEEKVDGVKRTARGCYGDRDSNGKDIKVGCVKTKNNLMCFCDKILCNSSIVHYPFKKMLVALCFVKLIL